MRLIVCPLAQIDAGLAAGPSHVLSLISPTATAPTGCENAEHLLLRFNDINAPAPGLIAPSYENVERIIAFARGWSGAAPMMMHCWAGISRSTAAAYIAACYYGAVGAERDLALDLRRAAPEATPNPLMVALADRSLRREGRMVQAIGEIGRGAEAGVGTLFHLAVGR